MATLHLVSNPRALTACLRTVANDDVILLLGDGVYARSPFHDGTVAALAEDVQAYGATLTDGIEPATIEQFVAWAAECETSISWT